MAEASAAVIIAHTVGLVAGAAAAVGLVIYGIYKIEQYKINKQHRHQKKNEGKSISIVDYEAVKQESKETTVRQRNIKKEEVIQNERNESKYIMKKDTSVEPPKEKEQCHKEVQTISEQGTQTGTCVPQDFTLPIYENLTLNDDNASVSSSTTFGGTLSSCDSLASTETVIPDIDQDLLGAKIPTWSELSDADRALCLCPSCEKEVCTVTIPCEHPYLCDECAPVMRKFYSRCPLCRKRITGYRSI